MNLVKKFPASTYLEVTNRAISLTDLKFKKTPEVTIGNKPIEEIKVGEYVIADDHTYSKVTAINTSEGPVKKVHLSSGASFKIDGNSVISVGEEFSEHSLVDSTVVLVEDLPSETLYELVLEGSGKLIVENIELD